MTSAAWRPGSRRHPFLPPSRSPCRSAATSSIGGCTLRPSGWLPSCRSSARRSGGCSRCRAPTRAERSASAVTERLRAEVRSRSDEHGGGQRLGRRRQFLNYFALRHFQLSHDGVLVVAVDSRPTAAYQLPGSERGEDDELER